MMMARYVWLFMTVVTSTVSATSDFPALDHIRPSVSLTDQSGAVKDLIYRVIGQNKSQHFKVVVDDSIGPRFRDTFNILSDGDIVTISGTSGVAAAMGFYHFLTTRCHCQITWSGKQLNLPHPLPVIGTPGLTVTTNDRFRYYQNVCTSSYSFAFWDWPRWEQHIDWMALSGINLPLAFTGQEAIFQKVYMSMGLTTEELQEHFGGPAFLAWARMGNMHGWGGPIPEDWIESQRLLQHKILQRMRSLGMIAVLSGFAGHVPIAITRLYPNASVSRLSDWGHFNLTYCCTYLLDFEDPLFQKIGSAFIEELRHEYGVDHIYNADSFNEMAPKSSDPAYLKRSGKAVYDAMRIADPDAIWLMQGWLFLSKDFWKNEQIEAVLTSVPKGKMIVLDLFAEVLPVYSSTLSFYGQPFIWCMLHNFGGTMELYGTVDRVNEGPFEARVFPNSTMIGTGLTPEGIFTNEVMYELMNENAIATTPRNLTLWFSEFARNRYGETNPDADMAWQLLKRSMYNCHDNHSNGWISVLPTRRPKLKPWDDRSVYSNTIQGYGDFCMAIPPTFRPNINFQLPAISVLNNTTPHFGDHSTALTPTFRPTIPLQLPYSSVYASIVPRNNDCLAVTVTFRPTVPAEFPDGGIFNNSDSMKDHCQHVTPTYRPDIHLHTPDIWYDPFDLFEAWLYMVRASKVLAHNPVFRYDLVDITRNSLSVIAIKFYGEMVAAYQTKNMDMLQVAGKDLLSLMADLERVLGSDSHFLLGHWIEEARNQGITPADKDLMEYNARNQITLWGPNGEARDYACKQWSGLTSHYYTPRWELFYTTLESCLKNGTKFDQNSYNEAVFTTVEQPFTFNRTSFPTTPTGDSVAISTELFNRYFPHTQSEFYSQLRDWSSLGRGQYIHTATKWVKSQWKADRLKHQSFHNGL